MKKIIFLSLSFLCLFFVKIYGNETENGLSLRIESPDLRPIETFSMTKNPEFNQLLETYNVSVFKKAYPTLLGWDYVIKSSDDEKLKEELLLKFKESISSAKVHLFGLLIRIEDPNLLPIEEKQFFLTKNPEFNQLLEKYKVYVFLQERPTAINESSQKRYLIKTPFQDELKEELLLKYSESIPLVLDVPEPVLADELQIKIGNDTTFCDGFWKGTHTHQLGTDLKITGGAPPYKYAWSVTINTYGYYTYASDYLNDTTISNPTFKSPFGEQNWETVTLTVTDAENNTATDVIKVRFSLFGTHLGYQVLYQNIGDEITLRDIPIGGGIEPYRSYEWSPADDLLTPYEKTTICRVTQSADYSITITDAVGCKATGTPYQVRILPTSGIETEYADSNIPFIKDGILFWKNQNKLPVKINLYSFNGVKIKEIYSVTDEYSLKNNVSVPVLYEIIIGTKRYAGKYIFNQ